MEPQVARALLINGTVGSGKTSVADAIGGLLAGARIPSAVIDLDWLRRSWPQPPGDRFHQTIELRNLRALSRNYRHAGVQRLVVAGVLENRAERWKYESAPGCALTVCRLRVDLELIRSRLRRRYDPDEPGLRWHLHRSGELHDILQTAQVDDKVVDVGTRSVVETASAVLTTIGWSYPVDHSSTVTE